MFAFREESIIQTSAGGGENGDDFLGWAWTHFIYYEHFLKVVSATFLLVCFFISVNKRTCQTRKNAFYFTSKALFILEKIKF